MTLSEMAKTLREFDTRIPSFASDVAATACIVGLTDLVNVTPVDTGQALSNWQVSLNKPVEMNILPYAPGIKGKMISGSWTHQSPIAAVREANIPPTLEAARAILLTKKPGDVIFLQNRLPYIAKLNNGSSGQAPAGFVERAELLIQDQVSKAVQRG